MSTRLQPKKKYAHKNRQPVGCFCHLLLRRLSVRLKLRDRLVLLRGRVTVGNGLVGLLELLRGGHSVVTLRGGGTVWRRRPTVGSGGGSVRRLLLLLLLRRSPTAKPVVALFVLDHHLDVALSVVRCLSDPSEGDATGGGVRSGVGLGRNLNAATSAVLQLFDG